MVHALPAHLVAFTQQLVQGNCPVILQTSTKKSEITFLQGTDAAYVMAELESLSLGWRLAPGFGSPQAIEATIHADGCFSATVESGILRYELEFVSDPSLNSFDVWTWVTAKQEILINAWELDIFFYAQIPVEETLEGEILAAQRFLSAPICYATTKSPVRLAVLYGQDYSLLSEYFEAMGVLPESAVRGRWPEMGYGVPASDRPLPFRRILLSRSMLFIEPLKSEAVDVTGEIFLKLLDRFYGRLDKPSVEERNWKERADRSVRDLAESPKATTTEHGPRLVRPYVNGGAPDSMVQAAIATGLATYQELTGEEIDILPEIEEGLDAFWDEERNMLHRYVPNAEGEEMDQMDSWYLYHPLMSLGRYAKQGSEKAESLLLQALPFARRVAHKFAYVWPIQFNLDTLEPSIDARGDNVTGESDLVGLYAYVLLLAHEITGEEAYLTEAKEAVQDLKEYGFRLMYQGNLVAAGALACGLLFKQTHQKKYLTLLYQCLATYFHNCVLWQPQQNCAGRIPQFMNATCLHDAPYAAAYEMAESYAAFHQLLTEIGDDMSPSARHLIEEHLRYSRSNCWYFYPDVLPEECVNEKSRDGEIDRSLSFPLEDLYPDGRKAGEVGQEVYGSALAFIMAAYPLVKNK